MQSFRAGVCQGASYGCKCPVRLHERLISVPVKLIGARQRCPAALDASALEAHGLPQVRGGGPIERLILLKEHIDSMGQEARTAHLDSQQHEEYLGPCGYQEYFTNQQGEHICAYFWPASAGVPFKGVVQLAHGMGSYVCFEYLRDEGIGQPKVYAGSWVQQLNQAGYSVCGIDNAGFGRSGGLFGYCDSYKQWVADLLQFAGVVQAPGRAGFAGGPLFLLGCSLGGNLILHAAIQQPELFAGVMVLAPMVTVEKIKESGLNRFFMKVADALNMVVPAWPIVGTSTNTMFPQLQDDWEANPGTYSYPLRVRVGVACVVACDDLCATMHQLQLPLLAVHSLKDTMTDPNGSKQLINAAQSPDKTLKLIDHMWHTLVKEEGNRELLQDVMDWMAARTGVGR